MFRISGRGLFGLCAISAALAGCMLDVDEDERIDQVSSAITIAESHFVKTESVSWPKTVTWCVNSGHQGHLPFQWERSWAPGTTGYLFSNCISREVSTETCNLWVKVAPDGKGHTSGYSYYSVFDHRPITITSDPSPATVPVGDEVELTAHGAEHCGGTGSFYWEVKGTGNTWYKVFGTDDVNPWTVSSPTAGDETYRVYSTHQGVTQDSDEIVVTWTGVSSTCTIGGATYSDGAVNPLNECQICDVSQSTTGWSNRNGHNYPSGSLCLAWVGSTTGTCVMGDCAGQTCLVSWGCHQAYCEGGAPVCNPT